jgi:transposase
LTQGSKKLVAIYLSEHKGRSTRYIADKLDVNHSTVSRWIKQSDKIKAENKEALSLFLFELLLVEEMEWSD